MLTYGELPENPAPGVSLYCETCSDDAFSACRGDYFYAPDDMPVTCNYCSEPMFLGRSHTTIERI